MIYQHREHYEGCKRKACDRAHHQTAAKLINNISTAARSRLRTANCTTNEERTQEEFLQKRLQTSISPRHTCTQMVARSEAITRKVSASKTAERRIFSFRSSSSTSSDYTDVVWLTSYSIQEQVLQVRREPQALNWGFSAVSRTHHRHHLFCPQMVKEQSVGWDRKPRSRASKLERLICLCIESNFRKFVLSF
jgi:hypothetical protein